MSAQEDTSMDINQIMSIIPHRYPFLLVDRIKEIILGESIIGIKNVTFNEPQFTGHFPSRPIMPGVLIVEAMAQLSAVLVAKSMESTKDKEVFFMSIEESKFRKIVEKLENTNKPYFSIILTDFNLTLDILKKNHRKSSKLR